MVGILIFILILSFLVLIHELGHFIVAKLFKVTVEEFGLGYPPKAVTLFKKWGSDFTLNWVPFGGFVKMQGEFAEEAEETDTKKGKKVDTSGYFTSKSAGARLAIILAGATVNFLYGVLAFSLVFSIMGIPSYPPIIQTVQENSPAAMAGVPTGVKITQVRVAGETLEPRNFLEVSEKLRQHPGETATITTTGVCQGTECAAAANQYTVQLRTAAAINEGNGPLGIAFDVVEERIFYPWYEMPFRGALFGIEQAIGLGWAILSGLGKMVTDLVTGGVVPKDVMGPVGIIDQAQSSGLFERGLDDIVLFSGMLSINLAIMNVLPIPALDGGRAVFIILEKILGKRRVAKVEGYANYGGLVVLIGLIVLVSARDIYRLFQP